MSRKYFFKSQSSLQKKVIAGGLSATFAFGTVGSGFAGAAEQFEIPSGYEDIIIFRHDRHFIKKEKDGEEGLISLNIGKGALEIISKIKEELNLSGEEFALTLYALNHSLNNPDYGCLFYVGGVSTKEILELIFGKKLDCDDDDDTYEFFGRAYGRRFKEQSQNCQDLYVALAFFALAPLSDKLKESIDSLDITVKYGFEKIKSVEDLSKKFRQSFPEDFVKKIEEKFIKEDKQGSEDGKNINFNLSHNNESVGGISFGEKVEKLTNEKSTNEKSTHEMPESKKNKTNLPKILGLGLLPLLLVALIIIYFVGGSGAQEIKDKSKMDGTETKNGEKPKDIEPTTGGNPDADPQPIQEPGKEKTEVKKGSNIGTKTAKYAAVTFLGSGIGVGSYLAKEKLGGDNLGEEKTKVNKDVKK